MVTTLQKKAFRELRGLLPQAVTIASVVACGVAAYVALTGAHDALTASADGWNARLRLAHAWAHLERAPRALVQRLAELEGVASVEARLLVRGSVPISGLPQPATATLVSLPDRGEPAVNAVAIMAGRAPDPAAADEVVVMAAFMDAHGLRVGDPLTVIVEGVQQRLRIVGRGSSSEFIFPVAAGQVLADARRATVLWMTESALAPMVNMRGAFNDVGVRVEPGASVPAVLARLDDALRVHGALPSYGRDKQVSARVLEQEMGQLRMMSVFLPALFLAVAAFVIYIVLGRLIQLQRGIIATLKAVGYGNRELALHYVQTALLVVLLGTLPGLLLGHAVGGWMVDLYAGYFFFPTLAFELAPARAAVAVCLAAVSAVAGALIGVRAATRMSPAEAMQEAPPTLYRRGLVDVLGLARILATAGRMTVRQLERRPIRTAFSALGIALSVSLLVTGRFALDSIDELMDLLFMRGQRGDVTVSFLVPRPWRAVHALEALPGVLHAEGSRAVAVRVRANGRSRDSALTAHEDGGVLTQVLDSDGHVVAVPREGVMLTRKLAEVLGVRVGDRVDVDIMEASDRTVSVAVAALVDEPMGMQLHATMDTLHGLLRQDRKVTSVALVVDPSRMQDLQDALARLPTVAGVARRTDLLDSFRLQLESTQAGTAITLTLFALVMALAIVYNNARVALSQRAHELATLRVLGFTRAEIASVLNGELIVQLLAAIPLGAWLGGVFARAIMATVDPEMYRIPVVIAPTTYAISALTVAAAGLMGAAAVRARLDHLDLVAVLKTRE